MGNRRWFGLIAISLAVATIIVDTTVINVAVPSIVSDFSASSTDVLWIQESYTVVFAALLLTFGSIADLIGRRRVLLIGVALFTLASVAAALAPSAGTLILARLVQGVGGAMVLPSTLSIVNATFVGRQRGIAFAVWGSTIGGMAAVGPVLGGWLTTDFSWRWAFAINIVLGVLIVTGALLFVDESRSATSWHLDIPGALLSALTCAALVFGLVEGRTLGWWQVDTVLQIGTWSWPLTISPVPFALAIAVLGGVALVLTERRRAAGGRPAMLALDLLTIRSFRNGNLVAMIVALGEFGIILVLPLWLQNVLGYSAIQAGLVLLALAGGSFLASGFAGAYSGRIAPITIVRAGLAAEIIGIAGIGCVITADTPWYAVTPFLAIYGFGVGLATAQLTGVILQQVPVTDSGRGSGTQSTSRQLGSALGIALLGTIFYATSGARLSAALTSNGTTGATATRIVDSAVDSSGGTIATLTGTARVAAEQAFAAGTQLAAFSAAGFLALGLLATLSLGAASARTTPERRPADQPRTA